MGGNVLMKLRSRKGASLTFALLAFLVCAAVSAVLLAAGMAAAGRVSNLEESDQRFYAVESAVQLFCDALDGQSFTIEQVQQITETEHKVYKKEDSEFVFDENATSTTTFVNPNIPNGNAYQLKMKTPYADDNHTIIISKNDEFASKFPKNRSFLSEAALYYVFGNRIDENHTDMLTYLMGGNFAESAGTKTLTPRTWELIQDVGGQEYLKVKVIAVMSSNGNIELTFTNENGADKFSMVVELSADIKNSESSDEPKNLGSGSFMNDAGNELTTWNTLRTDTTKRTEIRWTVSKVKKVSA